MRVNVELNTPEVQGHTGAHLVLRDPESSLPVAEIAIRGAGYIVLTEAERAAIAAILQRDLEQYAASYELKDYSLEIPDREGGYHGEAPLWTQVAEEQAAKRAAQRGGGVIKVGGKKIRVPQSLEDINYPEGVVFLEPDADGISIVKVPSRKGETAEMKRFRRACKRARAQQFAFLAAQKTPEAVEDGEPDAEEGGDE